MKPLSVISVLLILLALAACSRQEPSGQTATPQTVEAAPTMAPPTEEPPTPEPAGPTLVVDPNLIDREWQWVSRDPNGNPVDAIEVPNPENYTLTFAADGVYFAQFDCNRGSGAYVTDGTGILSIEAGMTSLAMCPADSLDITMKELLGQTHIYRFEEGGDVLILEQADAGPIHTYRVAGTESSTAVVADNALIDQVWQWERRDPNGNDIDEIIVPDPEDYALTFNEDGTFFARLDCNLGNGTYTSSAPGSIFMALEATTRAMCPPDSLGDAMAQMFGPAQNYRFEEDGAVLVFPWVADGPVDYYRLAGTEATPSLIGTTWQWLGTMTGEGPLTVADSSRYTIIFNDDGTANIVADCKQPGAEYSIDGSSISITPGPTTLQICSEESQEGIFLTQLSGAAIYFFQDGDLYIDLFADAGTMRFGELPEIDLAEPAEGEPTGTVNAPDGIFLRSGPGTNYTTVGTAPLGESGRLIGISEDGEWYVVDAPGQPEGQVWVAADFITTTNANNLPVVPAPPLAQSLVGPIWQWAGTTTPVETITVADPSRYQIAFLADGTAAIQADCNSVTATYTVEDSSISIIPGASTLAMCPSDSQDQEFVQQLSNAAVFFFQDNDLFIDQFASAGTMRFVLPSSTEAGSGGPIIPGATGITFRVIAFGPLQVASPILPGTTITVLFDDAAGTVSGNAGCNTYTGQVDTSGGGIRIGPIASTAMACAEDVMAQEAAFLAALQATTAYEWVQERVDNNTVVTAGALYYILSDGTRGVIELVTP
jgi:heat shock protein HslJ